VTDLHHLQRPSLDIPLALRNTSNVVVDEQSLGLNFEHKAVRHFTYVRHELSNGLGEKVVEQVYGFDNDLVRVSRRIRSTL
jgi:hypothetical protein